jgi:hypothetical protein
LVRSCSSARATDQLRRSVGQQRELEERDEALVAAEATNRDFTAAAQRQADGDTPARNFDHGCGAPHMTLIKL